KMKFREKDHQAMQTLYSITLKKQDGVDYPVPVLERELTMKETEPPVQNK
ncbi:ABC transporter permease, partial [Bacillus cereus]